MKSEPERPVALALGATVYWMDPLPAAGGAETEIQSTALVAGQEQAGVVVTSRRPRSPLAADVPASLLKTYEHDDEGMVNVTPMIFDEPGAVTVT